MSRGRIKPRSIWMPQPSCFKTRSTQGLPSRTLDPRPFKQAFEEDMKRFMKEDGADAAGGLDAACLKDHLRNMVFGSYH